MVKENPNLLRNAYQRIYDMISSHGYEDREKNRDVVRHWFFFDDPDDNGRDAIFGLDPAINRLVELFKGGAHKYGVEKRIILLHGPVGSSKSTIARLLKKGLEKYTQSSSGELYTFQWKDPESDEWVDSPMHEEPLKLVPEQVREQFLAALLGDLDDTTNRTYPITTHRGDLDPASRTYFNHYMKVYDGDWEKMLKEVIRVKRYYFSEKDRRGIGTYVPKDPKAQDSTELSGDINYRKIAEYGSDSDARAFNFDGEFNVANRGLIEFVEVLKLDTAFLYDLLSATQEQKIKPRKFAQTDIDEVILGHTNNPEYRKLQNDESMEAFRDRTLKIDVGYNHELSQELKIYERDFSPNSVAKHIAPHTLEIAAMWAVLTRLSQPKNSEISLMQKLKLYNGKSLPGFTLDNVKDLREEGVQNEECMNGISPRYIQDKISKALASDLHTHINPFIIMNEIREGLTNYPLVADKTQIQKYQALLDEVEAEYQDIVKNEVQRAICADEAAIGRLCQNYVDNVKAYCQREKIRNKYTNQEEEPDEKLMRSVEEKIDIPDSRKDDFRRELMNYIGALAIEGKKFDYTTNPRIQKALELKLFEDSRHTINLGSVLTDVIDTDTQEKIEVVKTRLVKDYGYNEESAKDVIDYVASIFSRGDPK